MAEEKNILWRLLPRALFGPPLLGAAVFGPAWTFHFWQAWAFVALQISTGTLLCVYFYIHDPKVIERRLLRKEPQFSQKIIIRLWRLVTAGYLMLSGYDHRKGWSRHWLGPVPLWLEIASLMMVLVAFIIHFEVLKANRFGASVIHTESGQTVSTEGLYRFVRHPMYLGFLTGGLFTPLALGSYVGFFAALWMIPIVLWRLTCEENYLRQALPGYAEYCQRVSRRLIPFV